MTLKNFEKPWVTAQKLSQWAKKILVFDDEQTSHFLKIFLPSGGLCPLVFAFVTKEIQRGETHHISATSTSRPNKRT